MDIKGNISDPGAAADVETWAKETAQNLTERWQFENIPQTLAAPEQREVLEASRKETAEAKRVRESFTPSQSLMGGRYWPVPEGTPLPGEDEAGQLLESRTAAGLRGIAGWFQPLLEAAHMAASYEVDEDGRPLDPGDLNYRLNVGFQSTRTQEGARRPMPAPRPGEGIVGSYLFNVANAISTPGGRGLGENWREIPAVVNTAADALGWLSIPGQYMPVWGGLYRTVPTGEEERKEYAKGSVYAAGTIAEMFIPFSYLPKGVGLAAKGVAAVGAPVLRGAAKGATEAAARAAEVAPALWRAEKAVVKGAQAAEKVAEALPPIAVHLSRPMRSTAMALAGLSEAAAAREIGAVTKGFDWARGPTYLASVTLRGLTRGMDPTDLVNPLQGPTLLRGALENQRRATKSANARATIDQMLHAVTKAENTGDWTKAAGDLEEEMIDIIATSLFSEVPLDLVFVTPHVVMKEGAYLRTRGTATKMMGEMRQTSAKGFGSGQVERTLSIDEVALNRNAPGWKKHPNPRVSQVIQDVIDSPKGTKVVALEDFAIVEEALTSMAFKRAAQRSGLEVPRAARLTAKDVERVGVPISRRLSTLRDISIIVTGLTKTFSPAWVKRGKRKYTNVQPSWISPSDVEDYVYLDAKSVVATRTRQMIEEGHRRIRNVPAEFDEMLIRNQEILDDPKEAYLKTINDVLSVERAEDMPSWNDEFLEQFVRFFFDLDDSIDGNVIGFIKKVLAVRKDRPITSEDITSLLEAVRQQGAQSLSPKKAGLRAQGIKGFFSKTDEDIWSASSASVLTVMARQKFEQFTEDLITRRPDIVIAMPKDPYSIPFSMPGASSAFTQSSDTEQVAYQAMRYVIQEFFKKEGYTGKKLYDQLVDDMFTTGYISQTASSSNLARGSWASGLRGAVREALLDMDPELFLVKQDRGGAVVGRELAQQTSLFGATPVQGDLDRIVDGLWRNREEEIRLGGAVSTEPIAPRTVWKSPGRRFKPEAVPFPEEMSKEDFSKAFIEDFKSTASEAEMEGMLAGNNPTPKLKKMIDAAWEEKRPPTWTGYSKARAQELLAQGAGPREVSKKGRVIGEEKKVLKAEYKEKFKPEGKKLTKTEFQEGYVEDLRQKILEGGEPEDLKPFFTGKRPTSALKDKLEEAWVDEQARFINEEVIPWIQEYTSDIAAFRAKLGERLSDTELNMILSSFADGDPVRFGTGKKITALERAANQLVREARIPKKPGLVPEERALSDFNRALDDLFLLTEQGEHTRFYSSMVEPRKGLEQLKTWREDYRAGRLTPEEIKGRLDSLLDVEGLERPPLEWGRFTQAFETLQDFQREVPGVRRFDTSEFRDILFDPVRFNKMYEAMLEGQSYDMMGMTMQSIAQKMADAGVPLADNLKPGTALRMPVGWKQSLISIGDEMFVYADDEAKQLWKEFTEGVVEGRFKALLTPQQKRGSHGLFLRALDGTANTWKKMIISGLLGGIGPIPTSRFIFTNQATFMFIQQVTTPGFVESTMRHWVEGAYGSRQIMREFKGSNKYPKWVQANADEVILDVNGRQYTAGEIQQLMEQNQALKSNIQFEFGETELRDLMRISKMSPDFTNYLTKNRPWGITSAKVWGRAFDPRYKTNWTRLNTATDNGYREAMFLSALENGLTPDMAGKLARNVLFNYDSISKIERNWLARYMVFYSFQRLAFTETMKALVRNPDGALNNIARLVRLQQAQKREAQTLSFEPDYAVSRLWSYELASTPSGVPIYSLGPDIPQLKAVAQIIPPLLGLAEMVTGQTDWTVTPLVTALVDGLITDPRLEAVKRIYDDRKRNPLEPHGTIDPKFVMNLKSIPGGLGVKFLKEVLHAQEMYGPSRIAGKPTWGPEHVQYRYGDWAGAFGGMLTEQVLLAIGLNRVAREHIEAAITAGLFSPEDDIQLKQLQDGTWVLKATGLQTTVPANTEYQLLQRLRKIRDKAMKSEAEKN
jgi:hypothetical protein